MDAKTFISKKYQAALDELKAVDAEYLPKRDAALAEIGMTQKWLDEMEAAKAAMANAGSAENKSGSNGWASSRDLTSKGNQN